MNRTASLGLALSVLALASPTIAQVTVDPAPFGAATTVVVPQVRTFALVPTAPAVALTEVKVGALLRDGVAATQIEMVLSNPSPVQAEAVLLLPVPDGATIGRVEFEGPAPEGTAEVLPRDTARRIYDDLVGRVRDPALVEFAGYNLVRTSVFPVPAGGRQRVRLSYDSVLEVDGARFDWRLPRSESLRQTVPWSIDVRIESSDPISLVYSPSHELRTLEQSSRSVRLSLSEQSRSTPGPFLLSYAVERGPGAATVLAYPDPSIGGGYFLLLASPGVAGDERKMPQVAREVTLVIDRSGSMAGGKMDQAKGAAIQVIEGLADGERFNIVDYSTGVERFSAASVVKDGASVAAARQYVAQMRPNGGTNICDALVETMRQPAPDGALPLVLFLTDGLPTVGRTSEVAIREAVEKGNTSKRRIFTFGVGEDVNVPLLDRLADITRASATYVLPKEDIELRVASVFRKLRGPELWDVSLTTADEHGSASTRLLRDLEPAMLPDIFAGEQVVLLGQYTGPAPIGVRISGTTSAGAWSREIAIDPAAATARNSFVPRLWATRRIAQLVDQVRQLGATPPGQPLPRPDALPDPRMKELVEEIVRLSTAWGVLTEYTSFLAREGTNLGDFSGLVAGCGTALRERAIQTRSGAAALNQGVNYNATKWAQTLNPSNEFLAADMQVQSTQNVQQVRDRCLFQNDGTWVDSRLLNTTVAQADETVEFWSDRHKAILESLSCQGRQGLLAQCGPTLIEYEGRSVLVLNPDC